MLYKISSYQCKTTTAIHNSCNYQDRFKFGKWVTYFKTTKIYDFWGDREDLHLL